MPRPVIRSESLSKAYRLDIAYDYYRSLRETLGGATRRLLRREARQRELFWALRDLSFEVGQGEVVGIIGRNGAGKSTLLKILSRITAPTSGRVVLRGRVGSLLEVGTGFHPELTGRENIFLNGAILGMRRTEIVRNFDAIVAFSEVERFIDTPVKRYSSGMYLRLAFAVAAHLDTEILFVDEVLAVGDAEFQKKCLGKMSDVARHGRTVLFVSHNMAAMESLCERVLWLDGGRVREQGEAGTVVSSYLQAAHEMLGDRRWSDPETAPGNERIRLRRVRAVREDGGAEAITVRTPFRIECEYANAQADARVHLAVNLYNEQGVVVFRSVPQPGEAWRGRPRPAGVYADVCRIPADLLNDGTHWVELLVVQDDSTVVCQVDEALVFRVEDSAEGRGAWFGRWPGTVRPRLEWESVIVPDGSVEGGATHGARGARRNVAPGA